MQHGQANRITKKGQERRADSEGCRRAGRAQNALGFSPAPRMLQATMGRRPRASALASRLSDSAPGLIQSSAGCLLAISGSRRSPISAGTYTVTRSIGPGISLIDAYAGIPSTIAVFGFTGLTSYP